MALTLRIHTILLILFLALSVIGTILLAAANDTGGNIFAGVCSCVIVTVCLLTSEGYLKALTPLVLGLTFFWFPIGVMIANDARDRVDANSNDDTAKKVLAGSVMCLVGSVAASFLLIYRFIRPRSLDVLEILAILAFVTALVGCFIIWIEENLNELSVQCLLGACFGFYAAIWPDNAPRGVCLFVSCYVACLSMYYGLRFRQSTLSDGLFCVTAGMWVLVGVLSALGQKKVGSSGYVRK